MFCYLHAPFCRSRCIYCDFYVTLDKYAGESGHTAFMDAALHELALRVASLSSPLTCWESLYAGGGTPSLLKASHFDRLLGAMRAYASFSARAELTLEINPDALGDEPRRYREVGFNRVSVGVQSFDDDLLRRLSRIHSAQQAKDVIEALAESGFDNISLDLMYALPGQSLDQWAQTLETATTLPVTHLSAYGLKIEDGTPLARLAQTPRYAAPDDDLSAEMYAIAVDFLQARGFARYEISNFARPGFESAHNRNYWRQGDWLALGPGACGSLGETRYETARDLARWQAAPLTGALQAITPSEALENALIFGLRMGEGVSLPALAEKFGATALKTVLARLEPHRARGWLQESDGRLTLAPQAFALSNAILADILPSDD